MIGSWWTLKFGASGTIKLSVARASPVARGSATEEVSSIREQHK